MNWLWIEAFVEYDTVNEKASRTEETICQNKEGDTE